MIDSTENRMTPIDGWIWISWEAHRRTESVCHELGIPLFVNTVSLPGLLRYMKLSLWTVSVVARIRPRGVVTQNPSIVLTLLAALLRPIFRFYLVVDAHNEAVTPFIWASGWMKALCRFLHRVADMTIVTNASLAEIIQENGGRPFILEDKIPNLSPRHRVQLAGRANVVCISTFAKDEPIQEIISAVAGLGPDCAVYMTGNHKRWLSQCISRLSLPANLKLTGFLSDDDYQGLLQSADVVLDLTLMDNCLVCGAYEGVALGKPLVLSASVASKMYFSKGAIHTSNHAGAIRLAIEKAIEEKEVLSVDIIKLRGELDDRWQDKKWRLLQILGALGAKERSRLARQQVLEPGTHDASIVRKDLY